MIFGRHLEFKIVKNQSRKEESLNQEEETIKTAHRVVASEAVIDQVTKNVIKLMIAKQAISTAGQIAVNLSVKQPIHVNISK